MKFLSVCSGIEAASVAFEPLGWKALAFSEIEAFPRAVLQHHYPDVPLHGDFTKLKDEPWIVDADMLCGGTPCQAFSVAGLRQSLADDRGNLTLQFVLLANAIDHLRSTAGTEPAWILWENVPGVLSTRDNAFGAFLGGLCGSDTAIHEPANGWADAGVVDGPARCCAWRVMDAQHIGLAQRRKRVFVLAKGGAGRWAAADALLPIIKSSRWHSAPSRSKGEVAPTIPSRSTGGGGLGTDFDCDGGLTVMAHGQANAEVVSDGSPSLTCNHEAPIAFVQNQREEVREQDVAGALSAEPGTHQTTYVAFDPAQVTSKANRSNPQPGDPCHTLHSHEPPMLVRMREGKEGGGKGPLVSEDQSLTLATANDQVLAYPINTQLGLRGAETSNSTREGVGIGNEGDPTFTLQSAHSHAVAVVPKDEVLATPFRDTADALTAAYGTKWNGNASADNGSLYAKSGMQVRRLTPVECERLQGFPDGYTDIPWRGKPNSPDGPRYKALGNSWAVPVVRYIGEQIKRVSR